VSSALRKPRRFMEASEQGPLAGPLRCARCGGVIGVYEPAVHVLDGIARTTSRAADPQLGRDRPGRCYHAACHALEAGERFEV
jgi:hypothetical protein